jgi:spoIIIJ-associated protein
VVVTPAVKLDPNTMAGKAQEFLTQVTELMGVKSEVHITTDEEGFLRADLQGDTSGLLIGRRGETLDALQYLTSLKVNRGREGYTRVTLDTENYRAKREDTLIRLANRMANRATRTGRRVSLEPMNPYERRIIHYALQGNEQVDTHSEGDEPNRHVVITVKK